MVARRWIVSFAFEQLLQRRAIFRHWANRAVVTACWNSVFMALVVSPSVVTAK
jgi:hypothetical protein